MPENNLAPYSNFPSNMMNQGMAKDDPPMMPFGGMDGFGFGGPFFNPFFHHHVFHHHFFHHHFFHHRSPFGGF